MYVKIGNTDYTEIQALDFAPDVGLYSDSLPINEFSVEIKTDDTINLNANAKLYDDADRLWANYYITQVTFVSEGFQKVVAKSVIAMMDRGIRGAEMYENEPISDILDDLFTGLPVSYLLASSLQSETISGYMPDQTRRERLQQVCFVIGAYVDTVFTDVVKIHKLVSDYTVVPVEETYWRPQINAKDPATAIKITAYSFTEGEPTVTDDWLSDGSSSTGYYIESKQEFTVTNSNIPSGAPDNVVTIDNIKIVNPSNASAIITRLADLYFDRSDLTADVINDRQYKPGNALAISYTEDEMVSGVAKTMVFKFGNRAKSSVKLLGTAMVLGAELVVTYSFQSMQVRKDRHTFPEGYSFSVQTVYVDINLNGHRYVLLPDRATITGTMTSGTTNVTVYCSVALDLYENILHVVSVDDATGSTGEVEIA